MKINTFVMVIGIMATVSFVSCKTSDSDIKVAIEEKLNSVPYMKDVSVTVHDGVAVIKGICNDSLCMANCENLALHVRGVKSVINNLTKAAKPIQPSIIYKSDDTLMAAVKHALKGFETVQAEVNNGVISLDGEIGEKHLRRLLTRLNSLNAVMIDNNLIVKEDLQRKPNDD